MIQDCEQTGLHMLQYVLNVDLAGLVTPGQIIVELCGLEGCCNLLLCQLHNQSGRLGTLETVLSIEV